MKNCDTPYGKLVDEYLSNIFVEGITVGGLEICHCDDLFYKELRDFIRMAMIPKVTLRSRFEQIACAIPLASAGSLTA